MEEEREGEAENPGPQEEANLAIEKYQVKITIISANIHALLPRIQYVVGCSASILLLRETTLSEFGQIRVATEMAAEGWASNFGNPMAMKAT